MDSLTISLIVACLFLLVIVGFLLWYSISLLRKIWVLSANIDDAQYIVAAFRQHLEEVYKLESFYGDETLANLLAHANSVSEVLEPYENMYDFVEKIELPEVEEEEEDAS